MAEEQKLEGTKILALPSTDGEVDISKLFIKDYKRVVSSKLIYYIWVARGFIFAAILSLLLLISSSLVIFQISSQFTVEPFLIIKQDSSSNIVRNEPISYDIASRSMLMETFVKQYVIIRNTIIDDEQEMQLRWFPGGMMDFLSAPGIFAEFDKYRIDNWAKIFASKSTREVEIISVGRVGGNKSPVWKVDFKTYDISESKRDKATKAILLDTKYWTSSITAYFIRERYFLGQRLINPLGFTVVRYSQTEVEI